MTDQEVICEWMEPTKREGYWWSTGKKVEELEAYTIISDCSVPGILTLDRLHEVEERLTDEQWVRYTGLLTQMDCPAPKGRPLDDWHSAARVLIHLSAFQKIRALAAVLRGKDVRP